MRSDIRLVDLGKSKTPTKLMNVKLPENIVEAIEAVRQDVGCSKTSAVVALLNEGLDAFDERRDELVTSAPRQPQPRRGRPPVATAAGT